MKDMQRCVSKHESSHILMGEMLHQVFGNRCAMECLCKWAQKAGLEMMRTQAWKKTGDQELRLRGKLPACLNNFGLESFMTERQHDIKE